MDSFYIIVACVAIVLLILVLTVIGLMMKNQNRIDVYPPHQSKCPDYWSIDSDGLCIANISPIVNGLSSYNINDNTKRILKNATVTNSGGTYRFDFTKNSVCDNKAWANNYNIQWDGYSNAVTC